MDLSECSQAAIKYKSQEGVIIENLLRKKYHYISTERLAIEFNQKSRRIPTCDPVNIS